MTEPIKLPPIPDKIVGWYTTNRPDVEAWGRLAVEQNTAGLREQLQAARICGEAAEKATVSLVGQLREAGDSLYECLKRAEKAEAERDEARAELARLTTSLRGSYSVRKVWLDENGDLQWEIVDASLPPVKEADK
jgi:chromosome segregation ATPase